MKHISIKLHMPAIVMLMLCVLFLMFWFVFIAHAQDRGLIPCDGPECNFDKFITLIQNVINFLLVTVAIPLAAILFSYAGWLYLSAGGSDGQISQAHGIFLNVIFGLALALAAWLIVNTIANALLDKSAFPQGFFFLKQSLFEIRVHKA